MLTSSTLFVVALIACVQSAPQQQYQHQAALPASHSSDGHLDKSTPVPIISQSEENNADGSFNFSYEAGNGIKQQSSGFHKKVAVPLLRSDGSETGEQQDTDIIVHTGSYSYTAPDGTIISLNYVSDENGFQPVGEHLPTPPPIPDHVISTLQQQQSQQQAQPLAQTQFQQNTQNLNQQTSSFSRQPQSQRF